MLKGIDISKYQGSPDFAKVKNSGIDFAILRAGYGRYATQKDPTFENNYNMCKQNNIFVGTYWYTYAVSITEIEQEMKVFLDIIRGKQFEMPVALDMEYEPGILALTNKVRTDMIIAALSMLERAGYYAVLYASTDFIRNRLEYKRLVQYDIWAAQYANRCTSPLPYGMWQYTSKGAVPGIVGNVDMDKSYKDYPNIMVEAGLNGYSKSATIPTEPSENPGEQEDSANGPNLGECNPSENVNMWETTNDFIISATGSDKQALRRIVESFELPCRPYYG